MWFGTLTVWVSGLFLGIKYMTPFLSLGMLVPESTVTYLHHPSYNENGNVYERKKDFKNQKRYSVGYTGQIIRCTWQSISGYTIHGNLFFPPNTIKKMISCPCRFPVYFPTYIVPFDPHNNLTRCATELTSF